MKIKFAFVASVLGLLISLPSIAQTSLFLDSKLGEPLGGGQTRNITPAGGYTLQGTQQNSGSYIEVTATAPSPAPLGNWNLKFRGPLNAQLAAGTYNDVVVYTGFGTSSPQMSVSNTNQGCYSSIKGSFTIHEVAYSGGNISTLAVDFIQFCGENLSPLLGQLRINSSVPVNTVRTRPDPLNFPTYYNTEPNTTLVSTTVTISGIDGAVPISLTGGEYSINNSAFTSSAGTISAGQTLRLRGTSSALFNDVAGPIVTIGSTSFQFQITTRPGTNPQPDGDPMIVLTAHPFSASLPITTKILSPASGYRISLNNSGYSNVAGSFSMVAQDLISSSSSSASFSISPPSGVAMAPGISFVARSYAQSASEGTFNLPFYFQVDGIQMGCNNSESVAQITVHDVALGPDNLPTRLAIDFVQTCNSLYDNSFVHGSLRWNSTRTIDYAIRRPRPMEFTDSVGAASNSYVVSNPVTIRGITTTVPISIIGGEYSLDNGPWISSSGIASAGQQLRLRVLSSPLSNTLVSAVVQVGETSARFRVGTLTGAEPQPNGTPLLVLVGRGLAPADGTRAVLSVATMYDIVMNTGYTSTYLASILAKPAGQIGLGISFSGWNGAALLPGTYPLANPTSPGYPTFFLSNNGLNVPNCAYQYSGGKLVIHEIEYNNSRQATRIAADFELYCSEPAGATKTVFGYLRFNSTMAIDYAITRPDNFAFDNVIGVTPSTTVLSNEVTISGITVSTPIQVQGAEYSINNGPFVSTPGSIAPGQTLRLRTTAPAVENATQTATVTVGNYSAKFFVATRTGRSPQPDGTPLLILVSQGDDPIGKGVSRIFSPATLSTMTVNRADTGVVRISAAYPGTGSSFQQYSFEFGAGSNLIPGTFVDADATSYPGSGPYVSGSGPSASCYSATGSFIIHEISLPSGTYQPIPRLAMDFTIQCYGSSHPIQGYLRWNSTYPVTVPTDTVPSPLAFTPVSQADLGVTYVSNSATVSGVETAVPISVTGGEYSIDGGAFTSAAGIVSPGSGIRVRVLSANTFQTTTSGSVNVGGMTSSFGVTTVAADTYPDLINFTPQLNTPRSQWVLSNIVTITGINTVTNVTISGGEFSIAGRPFTSQPSAILPGETLQARVMSSTVNADYRLGLLVVGNQYVQFTTRTLDAYGVTLTTAGTGSGSLAITNPSGIGGACATTCNNSVDAGSVITVTASPSSNSVFAGWSAAGCESGMGAQMTCTLQITAATTITANFAPKPVAQGMPPDFNADDKPDLIWRNSAGAAYVWYMNGTTRLGDAFLANIDPSWKIVGVADFNGDGHPDLVWRNGAGNTYVWYMNGASFLSDAFLFSLSPEWVIQGVADFNKDGKPDFLMRNTVSGNAFVWFFNNASPIGDQFLFNIDPSWKVEGVGDLDADGQPDLLFRNTVSGLSFAWSSQFQGGTLSLTTSTPPIFSIDPAWEVVQVADWNADGKPDLVFRNRNSGVVFVWYLNGTTLTTSDFIIQIDPSWEIVPKS